MAFSQDFLFYYYLKINHKFVSIIIKTQNIMASTSETGHAKNVANFQDLIEFVTGYGATYNL